MKVVVLASLTQNRDMCPGGFEDVGITECLFTNVAFMLDACYQLTYPLMQTDPKIVKFSRHSTRLKSKILDADAVLRHIVVAAMLTSFH